MNTPLSGVSMRPPTTFRPRPTSSPTWARSFGPTRRASGRSPRSRSIRASRCSPSRPSTSSRPPTRSRRSTSSSSRCPSSSIHWSAFGPAGPTPAPTATSGYVRPRRRPRRRGAAAGAGPRSRRPRSTSWKWTEADFAEASDGRLPMGKPTDEWSYGDLDAGFKNAALVLDESFVTPNTSNQPLESRTAMAYWQNGKLYVHCSTQSTVQTVPAVARLARHHARQGRGGQRVHRRRLRQQDLGRDLDGHSGAPLEEGQCAGHDAHQPRGGDGASAAARPGLHGRMKVGFSKDGRITALDMYVVAENGPYEAQGDGRRRADRVAAVPAARPCAGAA